MNPRTDLPQILLVELSRTTGMFLASFDKRQVDQFGELKQGKLSFQVKLGYQAGYREDLMNMYLS